jgi:Flp pilus assembly protein TadG
MNLFRQQMDCVATMGRLWRNRRASVTLLVAVALPILAMMAGVGVEVSQWALATSRLQRAADAAALAGAIYYANSSNALKSAGVAADTAELNGGAAGSTRTWSSSTQKLTDGSIVVTLGAGITNSAYTSVTVTLTKTLVPSFTGALNVGNRTITATASADAVAGSQTVEACLLALDLSGGITEQDLTDSGSNSVNLLGCAMRTNASMSFSGSPTVNATALLSGDNIVTSGSVSITATTLAGHVTKGSSSQISGTIIGPAAQISDPYANNTALNAAFAQLSATGKPVFSVSDSGKYTLNPGVWSSWNIGGSTSVTLNPGLYVVTGAITITSSSAVTGSGVTIVHGGAFSVGGSNVVTLTAPNTSPTGAAVPAVLLASPTASSVSFSGSNTFPLTGIIYYPHTAVSWGGSSVSGSGGCVELIAKTITLVGSNSMAANCSAYGAATTATGNPSTGKLAR